MIDPSLSPARKDIEVQAGGAYALCEGVDEAAMVRAIARGEDLNITATICSPGGNMAEELRLFRLSAGRLRPRALGVLIDKERDGTAAETRLRGWLREAGFNLPTSPGDVIAPAADGTDLLLGYYLSPESASAGAIEQLFTGQITANLSPCVESYLACIESSGLWDRKQSLDILKDKVRLRVYLAARQSGTNTSLNAALDARHLSVDAPEFVGIKAFLRHLCA